jgi:hypothetical protein
MSLRQSSLQEFFPVLAHKYLTPAAGVEDKSLAQYHGPAEAGPFLCTSSIAETDQQTAQPGDYPFCTYPQSTSEALICVWELTVTATHLGKKRKEELAMSIGEPLAKRLKKSDFIHKKNAMNESDDADEAAYEPQPKRRKISHHTDPNAGYTFNADDGCFTEDEASTTMSEDDVSTVRCSKKVNAGLVFYSDDDDDDDNDNEKSYVDDETANTSSDDGEGSNLDEDTESTLSVESSSTARSISSPLPTDDLHNSQVIQSHVESCPVTSISMALLTNDLDLSGLLFPQIPKKASQRRRMPGVVVYEDETATPPGWTEPNFTDSGQRAISGRPRRVLSTADRGQENRRPVYRAAEAHFDAADILDEDDGSGEEVGRFSAQPRVPWPQVDGFGLYYV